MSDQGDAGQWRPATSDHNSADDTTGPIPAVSGGEPPVQGFPPLDGEPEAWSAGEDESSTGGFPSVPPAETRSSFSSSDARAPFEPADPAPADSDAWDTGTTPSHGTDTGG